MKAGFAKTDITPRVGVQLYGFGPFLNRNSIAVRDKIWARAAAFEQDGKKMVLISCDLIGLTRDTVRQVRELVNKATGVAPDAVMLHCYHPHSGPNPTSNLGWGEPDYPYIEVLPQRIASACLSALEQMQEVVMSHSEVPCEGIGLNREYDIDAPPLEDVLRDDWRPAKPELTDTTCQVMTFKNTSGKMIGFMSYFGCHPVVCCQLTRYIHGDYAGIATNMLERENPGSVGLFLQGAQGDVNSCVVHKPEADAMLALDIIASRFAKSVRHGLEVAKPMQADSISWVSKDCKFTRRPLGLDYLKDQLAQQDAILQAPGASEVDDAVRMATVFAITLRRCIATIERGESLSNIDELQALRIGPIKFLGAPLEIFQAIKNDAKAGIGSNTALVMGITNGMAGYAPDHTAAARGGYAADMVPLILGQLPYADIHTELANALIEIAKAVD
jgi:hypothetical protein